MRAAAAALLAAGVLVSPALGAKDPPPIEVYNGVVQVVHAPRGGMVRFTLRILRWSSDEEKVALRDALASGGSDGLVAAMEKVEPVAYLQIESELRHAMRLASTWETDKGRVVRIATDRPIGHGEVYRGTRSTDYPVGLLEFTIPPEGPGEGILLGAVEAGFDAQGRLEVKSLPQSTGAQRLTMIELQKPKEKKKKSE